MKRFAPLGAVLLAAAAGCVAPFQAIPMLSAPPSEETRAEFGRVGIVALPQAPSFEARTPARGWCEGALRGLVWGMLYCLAAGGYAGDAYVALAFLALSPAAGLIGAVVGGAGAPPAEDVDRAEADLKAAFEGLNLQEKLRDRVFEIARRETSEELSLIRDPPGATDTLLEAGVRQVRLTGPWSVNPDLALEVTFQVRMLKMPSRDPLYATDLTYLGRPREFAEWASGGGAAFREEIERALEECASKIVDETFLIYLPEGPQGRISR